MRRRKDRRREANAIGIAGSRLTIAHTRLARGDRTDTRHDLALGQAPMTHDALMAVGGLEIGMLRQELRDLRLDGLGQQRARTVAQNLRELVIERPWPNQLDNAIVGGWGKAYRSFSGEWRRRTPPRYAAFTDLRRHQLWTLARTDVPRSNQISCQSLSLLQLVKQLCCSALIWSVTLMFGGDGRL